MAVQPAGAPAQNTPANFASVVPMPAGDAAFGETARGFTQGTWDSLKNAYIVYHQAVWQSFLFYANETWIKRDNSKKLWEPQTPDDNFTPQPRINRYSPSVDAVCSNFQIPEIEAVATKDDDLTSVAVADIASKLADHFIRNNGLKSDARRSDEDPGGVATALFVLAGCVFSHVYCEFETVGQIPKTESAPGIGVTCTNCDSYSAVPADALPIGPDGTVPCPNCSAPNQPEQTTVTVPAQDDSGQPITIPIVKPRAVCKMRNPINAYPRPGAKNMQDTGYFMWGERFTLDEIWRRWQFNAETDSVWPDGWSMTYENALNYFYLGFANSSSQAQDSAMVLQMYVEPGQMKQWPDGLYCVVVNQKLVKAVPFKDEFCEHPITKGSYLNLPTLFFPRSVSFDLVEIQKETNSYESLIKLHAMTTAAEPIVVQEDSVVSEITGRCDKIIYWKALGPNAKEPHHMTHGSLDEGVYVQRDALKADFQNISMAVNVFRGQQEGQAHSGVAIDALRAQAEQMFGKPTNNWSTFLKETVRKGVKVIQQHYTVGQLQEIVGTDKLLEIQQFKTADLDTTVEFVSTAHGLPKTRDERRQEMMALFDKGALDINDPNVKQKVFELFGETGMMETFNLDASRARRENVLMREGQAVQVMPEFEDLAVHLSQHLNLIKSSDFDMWKPGPKQLLMEHTIETRKAMAIQAAQAAAAAAPPGKVHPKVVEPPQPQPQPVPGGS